VLSVKEIRNLAARLSEAQFRSQMGPFALIQRPTDRGAAGQGDGTAKSHPEAMSQNFLSMLFEFEDLAVAILPPLSGMDELTVGRQVDCDLIIDDASVSKRHAVLKWSSDQNRCSVVDVGSTNGTFLNASTSVDHETSLRDGDILCFGDAQYWFLRSETLYTKLSSPGSGQLGSRSG
jgi:hypothetical protein